VVVLLGLVAVIASWLPAAWASATTVTTISSAATPFATTNGDILAMKAVNVSGQPVLFFGGDFTTVTTTDGVTHAATNMAAVNEWTGALVYAATGVSSTGYVRAFAYQAGLLYIGGDFTSFSGVARNHLLAMNVPGFTMASWNPGASGSVAAIDVDSSAVYIAGGLGNVRALTLSTGALIWSDPVINGGVRSLLVNPATGGLYVAGFFDTVGGFTNHGMVEVNKATGAPITTFAPVLQPNSGTGCCGTFDGEDPIALALDNNTNPPTLAMGSGGHQNYVRLLNSTTGANIWDHVTPGDGQAVAVIGDSIVIGYHRNRPNLGAISWPYYAAQLQTSNGALQTWQAGISTSPAKITDSGNNGVRSFVYDPTTSLLIIGGAFTTYGATCQPNVNTDCTGGVKKNSLAAYTVSGVAAPPPSAPAKPTVTSSSATTADVNWPLVAGATLYQVQRSVSGANSFVTVGTNVMGNAFHDTGLTPGGKYDYQVIATNAGGNSGPSPLTTVQTVPGQPGTLAASPNGSGEIDLSWSAAVGATSYDVQRGPGGSGTFTTDLGAVSGTTLANTALPAGTSFDYRVVPLDAAGAGVASNTATATTLPAQVTGLAANVVSAAEIDLNWTGVTGATSYVIQRAPSGTGNWATAGSGSAATSFADHTVSSGTSYDYQVAAVDAGGTGAFSSTQTATTPVIAPGQVTGVQATAASTTEIDLTWTPTQGATSYEVDRSSTSASSGFTPLATGLISPSFADTTGSPQTTYWYQVIASNSAGPGPASAVASTTTLPDQVTGLTPTVISGSEVDLAWNPANGAASYVVQRAPSGTGNWTVVGSGSPTTSLADTTVNSGTSYDYEVAAVGAGGTGAFSTIQTATTPVVAPGQVTGLQATAASTTEIDLTWTAPFGATSYEVDRSSTSASSGFTPLATGLSSPSFADTTAAPQTTYWYQVIASNSAGSGPVSPVTSTTTLPDQVTGASAHATSTTEIDLTWNPANGAASYLVQRSASGAGNWSTVSTGGTATAFADTTVSPGTTYDYRVAAVGAGGTGEFSATQTAATPVAAPGQVVGLGATAISGTEIDLSWTPTAGATAYEVDRSTTSASTGFAPVATGLTSASFADKTVAGQTTYWYHVIASNTTGSGPASAAATATTPPVNPPLLSNGFEGGTNGAAITANNSGGASGNAFNVASCTGGTLTYTSNADHGTRAAAVSTNTTPCFLQWGSTSIPTASTTSYGRMYVNLTSATGPTVALAKLANGAVARDAQIELTTAGKLAIYDANGTQRLAFTNTVPSGWVRIEWKLVNSTTAGSLSVSMYSGDSQTPLETHTVSGINTGASFGALQVGSCVTTTSAPAPFRIDDVAYGTVGPLGPAH
jgi:fibronectin type 3 domain-containing protein